ncbi:MAG: P83/100 family protein [Spirochaetota bacterium]
MKRIWKPFLLLFVWLVYTTTVVSQKIQENELRSAEKIDFNNRSNRRADISVKRNNYRLGKVLAETIQDEPKQKHTIQNTNITRYLTNSKELYGADVITIGKRFRYGHINSLIRILSSYVENAYSYSQGEAEVISRYILYYNALHRNEKSYFRKKFTPTLLPDLVIQKIGISTNYKNWAGNSQIIIPIANNILNKSGKDILLDKLEEEVNQVLKDNGERISLKKKFDKLSKDRLLKEKRTLIAKKEEILEKEDSLAAAEKRTDEELSQLYKDPDANKTSIEEMQRRKNRLNRQRELLEKETQLLKDKEKELADQERKKFPNRVVAKKKVEPVTPTNNRRRELERENKLLREQNKNLEDNNKKIRKAAVTTAKLLREKERVSENVIEGKIYFMKIIRYLAGGRYNNEIYLIDPEKDDVIIKSDFTNITSTSFQEFQDSILVVGFEQNHKTGNKLVSLAKGTLKFNKISKVKVFWKTPVLIDKQKQVIYAFEEEDDKFYLTKFDGKLNKLKRSTSEINPLSRATLYGEKIYLTAKEEFGKKPPILIFDKENLELIKQIKDTGK